MMVSLESLFVLSQGRPFCDPCPPCFCVPTALLNGTLGPIVSSWSQTKQPIGLSRQPLFYTFVKISVLQNVL